MKEHYQIAIDGLSGAGKSTLAKALARELHITYIDTGALYRSVGLYMYRHNIDPTDTQAVERALPDVRITLTHRDGEQIVLLNGEDVSAAIRENLISRYASDVSRQPAVRAALLDTQRDIAARTSVVMDGRDIGTVILPDAEVKIYLDAPDTLRAHRRWLELLERGQQAEEADILRQMRQRDAQDSTREIAPAVKAPDAVVLSSDQPFEALLAEAAALVRSRISG